MKDINQSMVIYFIIEGISKVPDLQTPIFLLVMFIYIFTLVGNFSVLLVVCLDRQLHTPMHFFLANLSIKDMSSTPDTLNIELTSFVTGNKSISFFGCMIQLYIFLSLTGVQILILTVMSYDRYVAICKPLYYSLLMNCTLCNWLANGCWIWGFTQFLPHTAMLSSFTCYLSITINHFFCDMLPLLKITCSEKFVLEATRFAIIVFFATIPALIIFIPYIFIISTILKIQSSTGRSKAFYKCSSHLMVMSVLYVTLVCQYSVPESKDSLESNKLLSLFNTSAVPMLNPLIYSFKNKDVKKELRRQLNRAHTIII